MSFEIEVKINSNIEEKLKQIEKKTKNLKPVFNQIGYTLLDIVEENFENQSFLGRPWELTYRCGKKKEKKR